METAPLIEGQKSVLTEEQKQQWKEDGYLVLKGVLSSKEVKTLTAVVDQMYEEHLQQAYRFFYLAAEQGDRKAGKNLDAIAKKLSVPELEACRANAALSSRRI